MRGVAYWSDRCKDAMAARDSGVFARIQSAGPWTYSDAYYLGVRGVMAQWKHQDGPASIEDYGTPRKCSDGLVYFPSKSPLQQEALAKSGCPAGIDYITTRNVALTIAPAAAAPRFISFSAGTAADPADDFAVLAYEVFDLLAEKKPVQDAKIVRLVSLAVGQCYRTTDEILDDVRWITSADIDPILCCIMGSDPKAEPGEAGQSLSHASG